MPPEEMTGVYTAEQATDALSSELEGYGFDPTIIIAIISAIMTLLGSKGKDAAALQDCCQRKSLLTRVMLRRAMANEGVPFRQREAAVNAALAIGTAADPKKFATFASAC